MEKNFYLGNVINNVKHHMKPFLLGLKREDKRWGYLHF